MKKILIFCVGAFVICGLFISTCFALTEDEIYSKTYAEDFRMFRGQPKPTYEEFRIVVGNLIQQGKEQLAQKLGVSVYQIQLLSLTETMLQIVFYFGRDKIIVNALDTALTYDGKVYYGGYKYNNWRDGSFVREVAPPEFKIGDANGDGKINISDSMLIAQHVKGINALSGNQLLAADVDGDGKITLYDARVIANYLAGNIQGLTVEFDSPQAPGNTNSISIKIKNNKLILSSTSYRIIDGMVDWSPAGYSVDLTSGKISATWIGYVGEHFPGGNLYPAMLSQMLNKIDQAYSYEQAPVKKALLLKIKSFLTRGNYQGVEFFSVLKLGDVSGDGKINIKDSMFIAQYLKGMRSLLGSQFLAADVDGDGKVTLDDARLIADYLAGKSGSLGNPQNLNVNSGGTKQIQFVPRMGETKGPQRLLKK